jgi:hypothetical protein
MPGETEAGSAGMQPCRGIAWWAHRNDVAGRGSPPFALFPKTHRIGRPLCLENPRPEGAEYSLTESDPSPFHAEAEHEFGACKTRRGRFVCSQSLSRVLQVARVNGGECGGKEAGAVERGLLQRQEAGSAQRHGGHSAAEPQPKGCGAMDSSSGVRGSDLDAETRRKRGGGRK